MKTLALAAMLAMSISTVAFAQSGSTVPGGMPNNCSGASANCNAGGMTPENTAGTAAQVQQQSVKTPAAKTTGTEMPNNCSGTTANCNAGGMTPENTAGTAAQVKQQNVKTNTPVVPVDKPSEHNETH
jgi:hypothetical protein